MTSPLSGGSTPVYGLRYILQGQPARFTRQYLQENAETIEAALVRGGIAPPNAADLAALAGRVTTLEAPPTVAAFPFSAAFSTYTGAGWRQAQYWTRRSEAGLRGTAKTTNALTAYASYTIGTLPAAARPLANEKFLVAVFGANEANGSLLINADGTCILVPWVAVPAGQTITLSGPRWFLT